MKTVRLFLSALAVLGPFSGCAPEVREVQLPVQPDAVDTLPPKPHVHSVFINIHWDGRLEAGDDGRHDSEEKLAPYLSSIFARYPHAHVVIRADRHAPHENVFRVMMLVRNAGFSNVAVAASLQDGTGEENDLILNY